VQYAVLGRNNLAGILYSQKRHAETQSLLREALTLAGNGLGPEHPLTALCLSNLGAFHIGSRRYAEAEPLLARSLALGMRSLESRSADLARIAFNYAHVLRKLRRKREAREYEKLARNLKSNATDEDSGGHVVDISTLLAVPVTGTTLSVWPHN
jgi:hypothetical protein